MRNVLILTTCQTFADAVRQAATKAGYGQTMVISEVLTGNGTGPLEDLRAKVNKQSIGKIVTKGLPPGTVLSLAKKLQGSVTAPKIYLPEQECGHFKEKERKRFIEFTETEEIFSPKKVAC